MPAFETLAYESPRPRWENGRIEHGDLSGLIRIPLPPSAADLDLILSECASKFVSDAEQVCLDRDLSLFAGRRADSRGIGGGGTRRGDGEDDIFYGRVLVSVDDGLPDVEFSVRAVEVEGHFSGESELGSEIRLAPGQPEAAKRLWEAMNRLIHRSRKENRNKAAPGVVSTAPGEGE